MKKKKIVVKMSLAEEEARRNAMKLSVKVPGVASVTMDKDKGQITIVGDDVDPVAVARALQGGKMRTIMGCFWPQHPVGPIDLATVEDVKEEKKTEEKKPEEKKPPVPWSSYPYNYCAAPPVYQYVQVPQPNSSWIGW